MNKLTNLIDDEAPSSDFWVFGYGSLIWNPGFEYLEKRVVKIDGYHRTFCLRSTRYRGTTERPGLVLGLDAGGECTGVAFKVSADAARAAFDYLHEREMVRYSYHPVWLKGVCPHDASLIHALCFVVDTQTDQYNGGLELTETAKIICAAKGTRGENLDYLQETVTALNTLGIDDESLKQLLKICRSHKI